MKHFNTFISASKNIFFTSSCKINSKCVMCARMNLQDICLEIRRVKVQGNICFEMHANFLLEFFNISHI